MLIDMTAANIFVGEKSRDSFEDSIQRVFVNFDLIPQAWRGL